MSEYSIRKIDSSAGITDVRYVEYSTILVPKSGGTYTGNVIAPAFSATTYSGVTFYGDGSNLTGIASITEFTAHTGDTTIHYTKGSINLADLGSSAHTHPISEVVNLQASLDGKTDVSLFNTYTGDTATELSNKALQTDLVSHTGDTSNPHSVTATQVGAADNTAFTAHTGDTTIHYTKGSINLSDLGSSAHTHPISEVVNLQTELDGKVNTFTTGGTYNQSTDIIIFTNSTGGTYNVTGVSDTFITGQTFNTGDYKLTTVLNDATSFISDLSILSGDMVVTGGTYDINTGIIEFTNNSGSTFEVSGFTSGMTDSYTTTATTNGNLIEFENNILGNLYSVDITPIISGKTNNPTGVFVFNALSGAHVDGTNVWSNFADMHAAMVVENGTEVFIESTIPSTIPTGTWNKVKSIRSIGERRLVIISSGAVLPNLGYIDTIIISASSTFLTLDTTQQSFRSVNSVISSSVATPYITIDSNASYVNIFLDATEFLTSSGAIISNVDPNNTNGTTISVVNGSEMGDGTLDNSDVSSTLNIELRDGTSHLGTTVGVGSFNITNIETSLVNKPTPIGADVINVVDTEDGNRSKYITLDTIIVDNYVTGQTLNGTILETSRNGGLSTLSTELSGLTDGGTDTYTTGLTFTNNVLEATNSTGGTYSTVIEDFTGLTVNGSISATTISGDTFYGDGSNLTGITGGGSGTGLTTTITVGENVASGDLLYLNSDSKYWKADNSVEATSSTELRLATTTILADASGDAIIRDSYTTTGLSAGDNYWVGTGGTITNTQPTADNSIVRFVGTALSTTILEFNPDELFIEIITSNQNVQTEPSLRNLTGDTTLLSTDYTANVLSAATITLPTAVGIAGRIYNIKNSSTGTVTVATFGGQTIDGGVLVISTQYSSVTVQSDGINWIII